MSVLVKIAIYVIHTIGSLYLLMVLLRFLFQVVRADFYNPVSQAIAKATNPLLIPLRKVIPGMGGIDLASLVLALIIQALLIQIIYAIYGYGFIGPIDIVLWAVIGILASFVNIYFLGLIIVIVASWVAPHSQNPALVLVRQIVEPAMAPLRKIIPPLGMLDLSPIVAFLILNILRGYLIPELAIAFDMPLELGLVIGF